MMCEASKIAWCIIMLAKKCTDAGLVRAYFVYTFVAMVAMETKKRPSWKLP